MKLDVDLEWTLSAACRGFDPEAWFTTNQNVDDPGVRSAVAVCQRCPVRLTCLQYALTYEGNEATTRHGIYGGLTASQRNALAGHASEAHRAIAMAASAAEVRAWAYEANVPVSRSGAITHGVRLAYARSLLAQRQEESA